jgi:hypothetical protein
VSAIGAALRLVAAREDEGPHGQQYRLEPQDRSVHHADSVDHVQDDAETSCAAVGDSKPMPAARQAITQGA